jgi:hypothetical protein
MSVVCWWERQAKDALPVRWEHLMRDEIETSRILAAEVNQLVVQAPGHFATTSSDLPGRTALLTRAQLLGTQVNLATLTKRDKEVLGQVDLATKAKHLQSSPLFFPPPHDLLDSSQQHDESMLCARLRQVFPREHDALVQYALALDTHAVDKIPASMPEVENLYERLHQVKAGEDAHAKIVAIVLAAPVAPRFTSQQTAAAAAGGERILGPVRQPFSARTINRPSGDAQHQQLIATNRDLFE